MTHKDAFKPVFAVTEAKANGHYRCREIHEALRICRQVVKLTRKRGASEEAQLEIQSDTTHAQTKLTANRS